MKIYAPWTNAQVSWLNYYQHLPAMHPYTCGNDSSHGGGALSATKEGWKCPDCDYVQNWAHEESITIAMNSEAQLWDKFMKEAGIVGESTDTAESAVEPPDTVI